MTVTYEDVEDAANRLEGVANRTPVVTSRTLDERLGARLFLKCESFQRMGAFTGFALRVSSTPSTASAMLR